MIIEKTPYPSQQFIEVVTFLHFSVNQSVMQATLSICRANVCLSSLLLKTTLLDRRLRLVDFGSHQMKFCQTRWFLSLKGLNVVIGRASARVQVVHACQKSLSIPEIFQVAQRHFKDSNSSFCCFHLPDKGGENTANPWTASRARQWPFHCSNYGDHGFSQGSQVSLYI